MNTTKINWCDCTWNPVTGCPPPKISVGCKNCYAERMANTRLRGHCGYDAIDPFKITYHRNRLHEPTKLKKSRSIFVCSMGDLFHKDVEFGYIKEIFHCMSMSPQHTFFILTKRPHTMLNFITSTKQALLPHVYLMLTICNQAESEELLPFLFSLPDEWRIGLSIEPILGLIDLELSTRKRKLQWVIAGGETGTNARPASPEWVKAIRDQCLTNKIPFFFKSWGKKLPETQQSYQKIDGTIWQKFPSKESKNGRI